jgi:dihydroflavonol-4-reductase
VRAVVIGGTGFIGLNVVEALKASGHEVVATRRPSSNTIFLRRLKVPLRPVSLEEPEAIAAAMDACDTAFFCAGHYPRFSVDTRAQVRQAVRQLRNALSAARRVGIRRFVYTGSVVSVARPEARRAATEADGVLRRGPPGSTYFAVKLALEREVLAAARDGFPAVVLLPTGCFGPFDHKAGTGYFVVALGNGVLQTYVDGRINVVDVRDVAAAHVAAASKGRCGERYILGGHNLTIRELLNGMAQRFGVAPPGRSLTRAEAFEVAAAEEARCYGTRHRPALSREMVDMAVCGQFVDSAKARAELAFHPRPLEETVADSFEWYRQNGYIHRAA